MTGYTIYSAASGQILTHRETSLKGGEAMSLIALNTGPGEAAYIGEAYDGEEWWISGDIPTLRQGADYAPLSAPITEGDTRTLVGLPSGALVTVSRPEGEDLTGTVEADGMAEISFAAAGDYHITITADFPFRASEVSVHVVPIS